MVRLRKQSDRRDTDPVVLRLGVVIAILTLGSIAFSQENLSYLVRYSKDTPEKIHLVVLPSSPLKGPVTLVMPRAIPSGYTLQYYDRFVKNLRATSPSGKALKIDRESGPRWRIGEGATLAKIEYDVDIAAMEQNIYEAADASKVRDGYIGLLGYSVFAYLEGEESKPVTLKVKMPGGWPVFSTLAPSSSPTASELTVRTNDFFALADSQIAAGPRVQIRKLKARVPLFLIAYLETETDLNTTSAVLQEAFQKVYTYFEGAPFKHYTGHLELLKPLSPKHQYGFSMEHLNSSTYFLGADLAYTKDSPRRMLQRYRFNFAHHIVHSWIPKRVYGKGYRPFSWEIPPQIDTIWFNEGFAQLAAMESLADSMPGEQGRAFREAFLSRMRNTVNGMPAFIREMPLVELSRIGSTMYGTDFRTGRTLFAKGALMAAEMDQLIRERTDGQKRLRDSLRSMVKWGQRTKRPFQIDELPGLIARPVGVKETEVKQILDRWLGGNRKKVS